MDAALKGMADARWGTELGRLRLTRQIDDAMMAAGERWAQLAQAYRVAIGAGPGPRSAALERGSIGKPDDPDSAAGAIVVRKERMVIKRFNKAQGVLSGRPLDEEAELHGGGKLVEAAVRAVCERNECVGYDQLVNLRHGLSLLAAFWSRQDVE